MGLCLPYWQAPKAARHTQACGRVLPASTAYRPRGAATGVPHAVVRDHLEEFLQVARAHGDGRGVPAFVERELRGFLTCSVLAHGFARLRCADCGFERFVPFSCKGRAFCPSCGGRRMEHAS